MMALMALMVVTASSYERKLFIFNRVAEKLTTEHLVLLLLTLSLEKKNIKKKNSVVYFSKATISDWLNQLLWDWLTFIMVFVSKPSEVDMWYLFIQYKYSNMLVLLCGWPFISHPLFHSYFLSFFFVYSFPWLTEGIFGKRTIFDLISTSF